MLCVIIIALPSEEEGWIRLCTKLVLWEQDATHTDYILYCVRQHKPPPPTPPQHAHTHTCVHVGADSRPIDDTRILHTYLPPPH